MTIKRIHPMSLAKVSGFLYAMLGLIIGLCVTLLSLAGAGKGGPLAGAFGAMFGVAAIIVFPSGNATATMADELVVRLRDHPLCP